MSDTKFKRPDSIPFPTVWRKVKGRTAVNGVVPAFTIQDVPTDRHDDVVDFMDATFARYEPVRDGMSFWTDAQSIQELRDRWARTLKENVSVVAFLDDGSPRPRVVGANILAVVRKGDPPDSYPYKGVSIKKTFKLIEDLSAPVDPFQKYGVEEYVTAMGLAVAKDMRGQGLGLEVLRGRMYVGMAMGVKLTVTTFTAIESQTLAAKLGYETISEIFYKDYKIDGEVVFPKVNSKSTKLMAKVFE